MSLLESILRRMRKDELTSMDIARAVSNGEVPTQGEDYYRQLELAKADLKATVGLTSGFFGNAIMLLPRILFNLVLITLALTLQILWLVFLFGSVIGVVILLVFLPNAFFLPLLLLENLEPVWN